ncbi:engulfment and cell motility protein 1-like [Oscarella lobularis]|uniref:engulfment and cell motility protein 1-like n=1 Tax=Oscarella lobularis TaxID=121494 RepID=UPI003313B725
MSARPSGIIKLAINSDGRAALLFEFDQKKPLVAIIRDVCDKWTIKDPDRYAFKFADSNMYITEKNRKEIKDGVILKLGTTPELAAQAAYESLKSSNKDDLRRSLEQLGNSAKDKTFVQEFIQLKGEELLVRMIEDPKKSNDLIAVALAAYEVMMEHGIVSWDTLTPSFINKLVSFVNEGGGENQVAKALGILESVVLNSSSMLPVVSRGVKFPNLVKLIGSHHQGTQANAIGLINNLLLKDKSINMPSGTIRSIREALRTYVQGRATNLGKEMKHELYVFQVLTLNQLTPLAFEKYVSKSESHMQKLQFLSDTCFPDPVSSSGSRHSNPVATQGKKLGFSNNPPWNDFNETPPGMLALECMCYFAKNQAENCVKWVTDNLSRGEYQCPFGKSSIAVTKILYEILNIGVPPSGGEVEYLPVFYAVNDVFMEIFCLCIQLVNKTWREMHATSTDIDRVMMFVRRQILMGVNEGPQTIEHLKNILWGLTYQKIMDIIEGEKAAKEELTSQAVPVKNLREVIRPEIVRLVKEQRIAFLVKGTHFHTYSAGRPRKGSFWYCRLSPNTKFLHYGEVDENTQPSVESLPSKIAIAETKELLFGKDCPHMKKKFLAGAPPFDLAFSLIGEEGKDSELNFVAPDPRVYSMWTDGLRILLGHSMENQQATEDIETLLNMEMKLRLLDVENAPIPEKEPPIPSDPPNFKFAYDFS